MLMLLLTDTTEPPFPGERSVITIGAYDGLHLGHRQVIEHVRELALSRGDRAVVVTFDRHPASIVRPESAPKILTNARQRLEIFESTGIDAVLVVPFDEQAAQESPLSFIERVLVRFLNASVVVVGADFHFGRNRAGNVAFLAQVGQTYGFEVDPVSLIERSDGVDEPVSSTAIRRALAGGNVGLAAQLLGRPYEVRGAVVTGDQRGRLLGFPTANVEVSSRVCLPADGVYGGWYQRPSGEIYRCAINIGRRPTFYDHASQSLLEAHLIGFDGDLYGEQATVWVTDFLRSERKFDGIDALVEQLRLDVDHASETAGDPPTPSELTES